METPITPNADHFVRNHGGIPDIDEESFYFDVGGLVNNPRRITMKELKDEKIFPRQSTVVTIQCSGTRRIEQIHEYPGDGDELINAPVSPLPRFHLQSYLPGTLLRRERKKLISEKHHSGEKGQLEPRNGPVSPSKKSSNTAAVSKTPLSKTTSNSSAQTPISKRVKSSTMPCPSPTEK